MYPFFKQLTNKEAAINNEIDNKDEPYERKICEGKTYLLVRIATNKYRMTTTIENKKIYMKNLLNFNLINLVYQTNLDKFDKINLNIINEEDANVFLLMKHLFKEMGLKQRYFCFDIKKVELENGITFILTQNAEYGKQDKNIPPLFYNGRGSKDIFIPSYPAGALIDQARNPQFKQEDDPKTWHDDPSKLPEISKNLAWHIQQETQNQILALIRYAVDNLNIKNVVIAGGYGLNCVANYHFKKSLPADVNLYCEPIAHDGGTAIGAAKLFWHLGSKSSEIKPQTSLYYGPEYSTDEVQYVIDAHVKQDLIEFETVSYDDVAKLISEENIVSMYQGRSEAGPRALGNRSILFDPRVHDGKDIVNTVKGREWFRPFAATVLKESANDWFDMAGLEESPFMMYAVNVAADKIKKIPSVCHVDDTCRVQTVTEEQNQHYYNLISAFDKITNVPILFNTSFNLAGDPLVETIHDALGTLYRSKLKYMYLPELGVLITKKLADPEPRKEEPVAEQSTDNESVEENTDDNVTAED